MTDDAELRARIEAQVAARRADAAASETEETADDYLSESPEISPSARGGKSLTPTRPWQRHGVVEEPEPAAEEPADDLDAGVTGPRRGGLGPARPWSRRSAQEPSEPDEPPGQSIDATAAAEAAGGRLHPSRPWHGRPAADQARVESGSAAPAPSHPHVVLHGIGDEDAGGTPAPPPRMRGLLQRGAGRRRAEDDDTPATHDLARRRAEAERAFADERAAAERELAEQRAATERELAEQRAATERELAEQRAATERELAEQREQAERILAERRAAMEQLPETMAVYVPDDEAVGAFAAAAGALQDQPAEESDESAQQIGRRARRGRRAKQTATEDEQLAAAVAEPTGEAVVGADESTAAAAPEPVGAATGWAEVVVEAAPEESYPWQQKDEVDLDLHGAPTWDPGMYPPEDEATQQRRGRRALRWLLARGPEPEADDAAAAAPDTAPEPTAPASYEPEPLVGLPVAHLPVETFAHETAPVVEEPVAPIGEAAPVDHAAPVGEAAPVDHAALVGEAAPVDEAATGEGAEHAADTHAAQPADKRGSLLGRLRRRRAVDADEEPEEGFALPPVDEAWLEPPKPTRDWAKRSAPIELGATPDEITAAVGTPEPAAAPEPVSASVPEQEPELQPEQEPELQAEPAVAAVVQPEPEPEPVLASLPEPEPEPALASLPEPEPEPVLASVPEPEPEPEPVVRRRPSPGVSSGSRRPSPGVAAAAAPAATPPAVGEPAPAPRRRPSPGVEPAAAAAATRVGRPMPFELAGGAAPATTQPDTGPDISRFLAATEADDAEDEEADEAAGAAPGRGGGDGRWRKTLTRTGVTLLIAALAAVLLRVFIVQPYYIPSASMEPTLHGCPGCNDDHVLVDKISYDVHGVRVGDIVVFHKPENAQVPEDVLIKRVIALGGDRISMRHGRVYINGGLLPESYLNKDHSCYASDPAETFAARTVPAGDVFVMGDNRCNSEDSREFGPIKTSSIIGRAFMIIWPLNRIRFLGS